MRGSQEILQRRKLKLKSCVLLYIIKFTGASTTVRTELFWLPPALISLHQSVHCCHSPHGCCPQSVLARVSLTTRLPWRAPGLIGVTLKRWSLWVQNMDLLVFRIPYTWNSVFPVPPLNSVPLMQFNNYIGYFVFCNI